MSSINDSKAFLQALCDFISAFKFTKSCKGELNIEKKKFFGIFSKKIRASVVLIKSTVIYFIGFKN